MEASPVSTLIGNVLITGAAVMVLGLVASLLFRNNHVRVIPNTISDAKEDVPIPPGVNEEDVESMRRVLQSHAGIDISEIYLKDGYWMARTAKGDFFVSDILKGNHQPGKVIR